MRTILRSQAGDCFEDFEAFIVRIEGIYDEKNVVVSRKVLEIGDKIRFY